MYYNPSYMNPIMEGLNKEPLEGIASLAPTQPTQPNPPQMTPPPGGIQPIKPPPGGMPEIISGPGIIDPNGQNEYYGPSLPGGPGIIDPNFSPYVRNENLDLTDRAGIMSEYSNYIQGGMGSRMHTEDTRGGFSFMGEAMAPGSSTGFGDFRKFLDTYGIGDRLQFDDTGISAVGGLNQSGIASLADYQSQQNTGPGI